MVSRVKVQFFKYSYLIVLVLFVEKIILSSELPLSKIFWAHMSGSISALLGTTDLMQTPPLLNCSFAASKSEGLSPLILFF